MKPFSSLSKIHFVGIGGSGMSGLAQYLHQAGFIVSGSDQNESSMIQYLRQKGISIETPHPHEFHQQVDLLCISSAIPANNHEILSCEKKGIPVLKRAQLLGEIMKKKWTLAIAGTHGKTTTTYMLASILESAGMDPSVLAGGNVIGGIQGSHLGKGEFLVAEADEYDQSFLHMYPTISCITNISNDHLECYGTFDNLKAAFAKYVNQHPAYGFVVVNGDDSGVNSVAKDFNRKTLYYGSSSNHDFYYSQVKPISQGLEFEVHTKVQGFMGKISLQVPGIHNVSNSLGALSIALELGLPWTSIQDGLGKFKGAHRRLETRGKIKNHLFVDDYAHHPEEIEASLQALRLSYPNYELVAVFQPHLYSRTQALAKEFAKALTLADIVYILPIYASRETPLENVSSRMVVDHLSQMGYTKVFSIQDAKQISPSPENWKKDTVLVTLGAGDVGNFHQYWLGGEK